MLGCWGLGGDQLYSSGAIIVYEDVPSLPPSYSSCSQLSYSSSCWLTRELSITIQLPELVLVSPDNTRWLPEALNHQLALEITRETDAKHSLAWLIWIYVDVSLVFGQWTGLDWTGVMWCQSSQIFLTQTGVRPPTTCHLSYQQLPPAPRLIPGRPLPRHCQASVCWDWEDQIVSKYKYKQIRASEWRNCKLFALR